MKVMDSRWLEQCREGDIIAIEKMVLLYQKDIFRLAFSILDNYDEAEDSTQETFIAALRSLDSFRGDSAFKTWLFSISINVCRSRLRRIKNKINMQQILQNLFQIRGIDANPENELIKNEFDAKIWLAIQNLNDKHRIPLILRYYHDLSIIDIAAFLNIPPGTVHSRLNHARNKLHAHLKDE
jgi:RNA polymerase sigma-70 factor (ECF subfamily)